MSVLISLVFLAAIVAIGYGVWKAVSKTPAKKTTGTGGGGNLPEEPTGPEADKIRFM